VNVHFEMSGIRTVLCEKETRYLRLQGILYQPVAFGKDVLLV